MIYISHSWKNKSSARRLTETFELEGIPYWFDEQQIEAGDEIRANLRSAIAKSTIFLYLVSNEANVSKWVQEELEYALGIEHENRMKIVPVRLRDNSDDLPSALSGRLYATLEVKESGSLINLIQQVKQVPGYDELPDGCPVSGSVRLEEYRLVHTLNQAREMISRSGTSSLSVTLLDNEYERLDNRYGLVSEVKFPQIHNARKDTAIGLEQVDWIHAQSRKIILESQAICSRYVATIRDDADAMYSDAGYIAAMWILLHRLHWNTRYLEGLSKGAMLEEGFVSDRKLPSTFDGHNCDFVHNDDKLGSTPVPKFAHPWPNEVDRLPPWGLRNPFLDMTPDDVGKAVGEILAQRYLAGTVDDVTMPLAQLLRYGLS